MDEFKKKVTDQQRTIATLEDKLADLDPNFIPVETYPPHWGMSSDSAHRKREEIKRQQAQITQLAKERDEAVTKFTSLQEEFKAKQEEFKKKELQIREENQRKIKEYIDDADHWRIQVYKYCMQHYLIEISILLSLSLPLYSMKLHRRTLVQRDMPERK